MEKLTMNDGTVVENSSALLSDDLFLYINGKTFGGVYTLLSESRRTRKITYTQNNGEHIQYSGYTHLTAVREEGNGLVTAVLRKGER